MKIIFYGTRDYDRLYFELLAADPEYGCTIKFLAANLDVDTAPLAEGGDAVCAFVNSDCSAPVLEALAKAGIRLLLMRCAGYNNVDLEAARRLGITVLRVPGYSPEAVAEHAMALAQAANRRICKAYIKVRNNNFALDGLLGYNLYGSCAGIIGTGRIGAAMARICHGYGMTVLAYDQYHNPDLEGIVRYVELDELLRAADLISLHCPLTAETRHLINADTIAQMRDNAILVNTSRGGLIDTDALIAALRNRKFAGVGLDVYEDEDGQVFEDFLRRRAGKRGGAHPAEFPQRGGDQSPGLLYPDGAAEHRHHHHGERPRLCPGRKTGQRGEGVKGLAFWAGMRYNRDNLPQRSCFV